MSPRRLKGHDLHPHPACRLANVPSFQCDALPALGETTFDIHLNDRAFWRNVPANVWTYRLGGYLVLKKWLSYRECAVPGPSPWFRAKLVESFRGDPHSRPLKFQTETLPPPLLHPNDVHHSTDAWTFPAV